MLSACQKWTAAGVWKPMPERLPAARTANPSSARGRIPGSARQSCARESTGTKMWIEPIVPVSGAGAHVRALATAVEHQRIGVQPINVASMLRQLADQQSALGQQQTVLLQCKPR